MFNLFKFGNVSARYETIFQIRHLLWTELFPLPKDNSYIEVLIPSSL